MPFLPARYNAYPIAANIIAKNPIIGKVAVLGNENKETPQIYRKMAITSNTTNIKM
jgi:hypothetical protein